MQPWHRLHSTPIVQSPWMSLRADACQLPNGLVLDPYYVIEEHDWVHIFAQRDDGEVLCVRQYRHAGEAVCTELPGGVIDEGESPLAAAQRELREETGYTAATWQEVGSVFANPARQTNRMFIFLARGLFHAGEQQLDASEDIAVSFESVTRIKQKIAGGDFSQALHIASFYMCLEAVLQAENSLTQPG